MIILLWPVFLAVETKTSKNWMAEKTHNQIMLLCLYDALSPFTPILSCILLFFEYERVCLICSAAIKHLSISCSTQKAKFIWTHLKGCREHMKQSKATLCWNVSELPVIKESLRIYRKTEPNKAALPAPKQEIWKLEEQHVCEGNRQ